MTEESTPKTAGQAAGEWWAKQVGSPQFSNGGDGTATALATIALMQSREPTQDAYDQFAQNIAEYIQSELAADHEVIFDVDYSPDRTLRELARKAGIGMNRFPWKTMMRITKQVVIVSLGYGAEWRLVWKADDYEVPPCHRQQFSDKRAEEELTQGNDYPSGYMPYRCGLKAWHEGDHNYDQPSPLCLHCNRPIDHFWHDGEGMSPRIHQFEPTPEG